MASTEIEYGVKIKNGEDLIKLLKEKAPNKGILTMRRIIYKNGGEYFLRASYEESEGGNDYKFSLKEDIMAKGENPDGLKHMEEIDIQVDKEQLEKLIEIIRLLGFNVQNDFTKIRYWFKVDGLDISIDKLKDEEYYLEVEGKSENKVMSFVKTLSIEEIVDR